MNRRDLFVAALLSLFVFAVYLVTLAPDVLPGDSGEFELAVPLLGIVHPTGYPLYLLVGKLFTFLPLGTIAYRVNLFSAASAALAIGAFYLAASGLVYSLAPNGSSVSPAPLSTGHGITHIVFRRRSFLIANAAVALALAFSPTLWSQSAIAEVYALNALCVVVLIGLAVRLRESDAIVREDKRSLWQLLALALGLSLAHHRTTILIGLILVMYLYPFPGLRAVWKRVLVLSALPLLLYLYTPLRYDASPYLRTRLDDQHLITSLDPSPAAFLGHFLGIGFRGALRWDAHSVERLTSTLPQVSSEFTLVGILLAIIGLGALVRGRRWRLVFLFTALATAYTLFNALYQIGDISDFYTPLYIVVAFLMVVGAAWMGRFIVLRGLHWMIAAFLLVLPAVLLFANIRMAGRYGDDSTRAYWMSLLTPAVPAAILISNDRDEMTPLLYLQSVEGLRTDVTGLYPLISTDPRHAHVVPLTQYALETSRPVYFIKPMDGLSIKFRTQQEGPLVHVLGAQDTQPEIVLLRDSTMLRFAGWSRPVDAGSRAALVVTLYWQPLGTSRPDLKTYVHLDSPDGKTLAQSDHTPGGVFYPPSEWQTGDTLRDSHVLNLPPDTPAGEYQLVVGAYTPDGQSLAGVGHIALGSLTIGY
jgi:Protein of unknown function (DUF2723)